jgi:hypothetical protein
MEAKNVARCFWLLFAPKSDRIKRYGTMVGEKGDFKFTKFLEGV